LICFLACERNTYTTGQRHVDGDPTLRLIEPVNYDGVLP